MKLRFILILCMGLFAEDCILIDGQSNAGTSYATYYYSNGLIRSCGTAWSDTTMSDSAIGPASGAPAQTHLGAGVWGIELARKIVSTTNRPLFIINGGWPGTTIAQHLPSKALSSFYGRTFWRVNRAGMCGNVKTVYWWQGEAESATSSLTYLSNFSKLRDGWRVDYPNIQRVIVIRPKLCTTGSQDTNILHVINGFPSQFPDVTVFSVDSFPGWDGCHWSVSGYLAIGDSLYNHFGMGERIESYSTRKTTARNIRLCSVNILGQIQRGPVLASGIIIDGRKIVRVK